ncbi:MULTISPECIES: helix-turn-helix transcriptional regulator [unclassified Lonepinella]|uniref:helix-turn-helix transcriptional regulator n=1 Tax=unclassified Lonepinella TaxID=2642006 RepID=UPI0036D7C434
MMTFANQAKTHDNRQPQAKGGQNVAETKTPRLINIKEVMNRTSLKTTAIYTLMKRGEFPQSIKITIDRIGWLESDIDDWITAKVNQTKGQHQ